MKGLYNSLQHISKSVLKTTLFILVAFNMVLSSCSGTKKYYKKGIKLQENGMHQEAADSFYASLLRKRGNVDAQIGMKKSGQRVLNQKIEEFSKYKTLNLKKKAVYSYVNALEYQNKIRKIGVELEIPPFYQGDYEQVTQAYLHDLYENGVGLLNDGRFEEAEENFKEIGKFDSNYKDARNLEDIAFLEPLYSNGLIHYNAGRYRSAYNAFEDAYHRDANFKNVKEMRDNSLDAGLFTMALLPFTNSTNKICLDQKISAYALDAITNINDPFLKIVDRENLELIISEQQLGLSGVIDEETAVQVGNLAGAGALITGTVLSLEVNQGELDKKSKTGFESFRVKKTNPETKKTFYETRYKPTLYFEYTKENTSTVTFQYKIISLETGEVIASKIVDQTIHDKIHYAEYKGDMSKLFPERNGKANTSSSAKRRLDSLLNANKSVKSPNELSNDLLRDVSYELSGNIQSLMRELVN